MGTSCDCSRSMSSRVPTTTCMLFPGPIEAGQTVASTSTDCVATAATRTTRCRRRSACDGRSRFSSGAGPSPSRSPRRLSVDYAPNEGIDMSPDLVPGRRFPDLELADHNGAPRRLSELAEGDPVVLNFFRGWWCPKEQAFFRGLVRLQDEVEVAYTRMVSVSVDPPGELSAFRAGLGARWTFLSDRDRRYLADLGLQETTDTVYRPYV